MGGVKKFRKPSTKWNGAPKFGRGGRLSNDSQAPSTEAGAVGVASGTGFVGLLHLLPPSYHHFVDGFVYFAPALSIGTGFLWRYARIKVSKQILDSALSAAIKRASRIRDDIFADPQSPQAHRDNAQSAVEGLVQLQFDALNDDYARVKAHLTQGL